MKFIVNYSLLVLLLEIKSCSAAQAPKCAAMEQAVRQSRSLDDRRKYLRQLIENSGFSLFSQGQWSIKDKKSVGTELFIRFPKPNEPNSYFPTEEFILLASKMNLLAILTDKIIHKIITNATMLDPSKAPYYINVPPTLISADFVNRFIAQMKKEKIPTTLIGIELTERESISDRACFDEGMRALKKEGIAVALDDLGKHNATLTFLKSIPVNRVKIDQLLITEAKTNPKKEQELQDAVEYAKAHNIEVIAEGIETKEDLLFAIKQGCTGAQGYFFDRPKLFISVDA
ncbi:MAG: EAL domain-containing protein [Candidatus Paracaedibacteraceae bacterium]|nr:EAL domain-containing protein [Candidatus Paracaedibacteraceae bacterium]